MRALGINRNDRTLRNRRDFRPEDLTRSDLTLNMVTQKVT